jgi:hypothetical protein
MYEVLWKISIFMRFKFLTAENMKISLLGYCVVDSLIN